MPGGTSHQAERYLTTMPPHSFELRVSPLVSRNSATHHPSGSQSENVSTQRDDPVGGSRLPCNASELDEDAASEPRSLSSQGNPKS